MREKCPNTEFFLVRSFPHSECEKIWIRKNSVLGHFSRSEYFATDGNFDKRGGFE